MLRAFALVIPLLLAETCAEPPSKEMHQAQGAIDAAKAAGAEQYGADELKAAVDALAQANVAVTANDYRLALASALNSREHARNAAKAAVDGRARAWWRRLIVLVDVDLGMVDPFWSGKRSALTERTTSGPAQTC